MTDRVALDVRRRGRTDSEVWQVKLAGANGLPEDDVPLTCRACSYGTYARLPLDSSCACYRSEHNLFYRYHSGMN